MHWYTLINDLGVVRFHIDTQIVIKVLFDLYRL
jgi:hypothetical protein